MYSYVPNCQTTQFILSPLDFSFQLQLNPHCYGMWKEKIANSGGTHMQRAFAFHCFASLLARYIVLVNVNTSFHLMVRVLFSGSSSKGYFVVIHKIHFFKLKLQFPSYLKSLLHRFYFTDIISVVFLLQGSTYILLQNSPLIAG